MHIVMLASENGALPGGKVGGIGDVIRDIPAALALKGHKLTVINPGYQFLSRLPEARFLTAMTIEFANSLETVELFQLEIEKDGSSVTTLILEHPSFGVGVPGQLYAHDQEEPFATDATKFALFCHAACYAMAAGAIEKPDVIHLHDWHSAMLLILREYHPAYRALQEVHCVFSVHNLSLQGIRPLRGSWSSLFAWFPNIEIDTSKLIDPRYSDCMNLMRAGITMADKVHVVSPTYAEEIMLPSIVEEGLVRGEGLELDLQRAREDGRLEGILNGCDYQNVPKRSVTWKQFVNEVSATLNRWAQGKLWVRSSLLHAVQRLSSLSEKGAKPRLVVSSVGRLTAQKVRLLEVAVGDGKTALDIMLEKLDNGIMIFLGSGDEHYEEFLHAVMQRHANFIFLCGYSEPLSDIIYRFSDLFLMPSMFEPCGISQMLAMRAGTPCLVNHTGGLADTVENMETGFSFSGEGLQDKVIAMLNCFEETLQVHECKMPVWTSIVRAAALKRFLWSDIADQYEQKLYLH